MNRVIIGIGSNIAPLLNIHKALLFLTRRYGFLRQSTPLRTRALQVSPPQPMFINMGCMFVTQQEKFQLLRTLKSIEAAMGRSKNTSDMPRPIDLDLLVWNKGIWDEDVYARDFLQDIVIELMPQFAVPLARYRSLVRLNLYEEGNRHGEL